MLRTLDTDAEPTRDDTRGRVESKKWMDHFIETYNEWSVRRKSTS